MYYEIISTFAASDFAPPRHLPSVARPALNSYMYANAVAISKVAAVLGEKTIAEEYARKAARLKSLISMLMWDEEVKFFKVRHPEGELADVREEIGFIPWYFNLPEPGYVQAWLQSHQEIFLDAKLHNLVR